LANFELAVSLVLQNEGGFSYNPKDSGGATNFGISLRLLRTLSAETLKKCGIFKAPAVLDVEDMRALTIDQAKLVYRYVFWDAARFADIISQDFCNYIFDMSVLFGLDQAVKIAQRATWAVCMNMDLKDDGILGNNTLNIIAQMTGIGSMVYRAAIMAERAGFIRLLVAIKPDNGEFLYGWLKRCYKS
jgi:lysozyme family protein